MNIQTLRKFTAFASFGFAFFCVLWTVLSFVLLPMEAGESDYSLMVLDPQWTVVSVCGLIACIFGLVSLFGIYLYGREQGGVALFIGITLFVLGILWEFAGLSWDVFIWPVVCANQQYISFVTDGVLVSSSRFTVFLVMMFAFLLSGTVITALAMHKARLYGKWVPWLLIAGIVLYAGGNVVTIYVSMAGLFLYCSSFVLIGIYLLKTD